MQTILTPGQMRRMEQNYFRDTASPSADLMLRAASELVLAMDERGLVRGRRVAFICGNGGNGGDGLAAAAICHQMGADCLVIPAFPTDSYARDAGKYLRELPSDIPVCAIDDTAEPDVWVDALFGIGLNRPVAGIPAKCIARMNGSAATVVSVDIPSGVDGRTGDILGCAVRADLTVTFQYPKQGHFLRHGLDLCGDLIVRDIGVSARYLQDTPPLSARYPFIMRPDGTDVAALLPVRNHFSHKSTYGHLLLIAGSRGMAGAASIAARAALHSGAGLITIACVQEIVPILQMLIPEAMCIPLPQDAGGAISADALPQLQRTLAGKTAVAIGPGLSRSAAPEIVRAVLECGLPAVIDADALNIISADPALKLLLHPHHLITPHPGEAARMLSPSGDEIADAISLHDLSCQVIYKGAASIIATDDGLFLSDTGSPCMAKGGSGDMLTGIAGALLAQGLTAAQAAIAASHIHGMAGELSEAQWGSVYPAAMDMIRLLSDVWKELCP